MRSSTKRRRVLAWREVVLAGSETFIREQLDSLPSWESQLVGIKRQESAISSARDVSIFTDSIVGKGRRRIFKSVRRSPALDRFIRMWGPDLILSYFIPDGTLLLPTVKRFNVPFVVSSLGYDAMRTSLTQTPEYRAQAEELFDQAGAVLAPSEYLAQQLLQLGAPPGRLKVHYFGVARPSSPPRDDSDRWYDIAFVGRLVSVKGVQDALRAAALIRGGGPHSPRIVVAGDGELRGELESLAAQLDLDCTFLGRIHPRRVVEVMSRAKLLVGPSRKDEHGAREALGQVFLEAGRVGTPVVAYQSGGIPEAVEHGRTGLLVPEGDVAALAESMTRLLNEPTTRERMGRAGQDRVAGQFDRERQAKRLENLFDDVIRVSGRTSRQGRGELG